MTKLEQFKAEFVEPILEGYRQAYDRPFEASLTYGPCPQIPDSINGWFTYRLLLNCPVRGWFKVVDMKVLDPETIGTSLGLLCEALEYKVLKEAA